MNFIKSLVQKQRGALHNEENDAAQKERSLCIQHLRKLFLEFLHPPTPLTQEQRELKQYVMLPLFLKAFANTDHSKLSERFGDVLQFAGHTSKLMVSEVQRRAANKVKVQASKDILVFLCHHEDEIDNKGWNLIKTLNILTHGEPPVIECMVAASLQSILVKCIKLFFSLPSNFGSHERCAEVQKVLIPILVKLCNHPITVKELIRTDDLALLFETLTTSCKIEHVIWRTGVSEILTSVTRHSLTEDVISYINEKSCISLSLANIGTLCDKDPLAVVEMFMTLCCILKDSCEINSVLLDTFHKCHGYKFLDEILLKFSNQTDSAYQEASRNLVLLIASLVMTGRTVLQPSPAITTPFQITEYSIPKASGVQGVSIRNLEAFKVLMNVFLSCTSEVLSLHILNAIQNILNYDNANYFLIEPLHPVAQFIQMMPEKSVKVNAAILKLVEFAALHLMWVPSQELVAMTILFKNDSCKSSQCTVLKTLILLVNNNHLYKNVLQQAGLLDTMVIALKSYAKSVSNPEEEVKSNESVEKNVEDESTSDYLFLLMECLRLMVERSTSNTELFRSKGGSRSAHDLILDETSRTYSLRIVQQLIVDGGHDDLGTLLSFLHSTPATDLKLKSDVLSSILCIFDINPQTRSVFQEVGGFVYVVSILVSLEGSLADPPVTLTNVKRESILELIWMIFNVLTCAMKDEPVNKIIFMDEIRFKGLIDTIKRLGCFSESFEYLPPKGSICPSNVTGETELECAFVPTVTMPVIEKYDRKYIQLVICKIILSMATGVFDSWKLDKSRIVLVYSSKNIPTIFHPTAVNGLLEILPLLCCDKKTAQGDPVTDVTDILSFVVYQVQHLMGTEINQQLMCGAGLPYLLLAKCKEAFIDEKHPLNGPLTKLFERLAGQSLHPTVLRKFLRLGSPLCSNSSYAVLRGPNKEKDITNNEHKPLEETPSKKSLQGLSSLRISNGDIQLPCDENNTGEEGEDISFLHEAEFQPIDDDGDIVNGRDSKNVNGDDIKKKTVIDNISLASPSEFETELFAAENSSSNGDTEFCSEELVENVFALPTDENIDINIENTDGCAEENTEVNVTGEEEVCPSVCESAPDAVERIVSLLDDDNTKSCTHFNGDFQKELYRLCDQFEGRPLPQNLVKSVVSLTTPRDVLSTSPLESPAFIEFNMNEDGYGCLFIPAINPQVIQNSPSQPYVISTNSSSINLTNLTSTSSERTFPPQAGLTYSGWVYLDHVQPVPNFHSTVSLFTVEKQFEELSTKRLINSSIFQIYLDLQQSKLVVSTEDQHASDRGKQTSHTRIEVFSEELFQIHKWNHVSVVLQKSMMRHSSVSVYINSRFISTSKIKYIHHGMPVGADVNTCKTIAYIGTHPKHCHISGLVWRMGPMALIEEPLLEESILLICSLGPGYIGCFQSPCVNDLPEEDSMEIKLSPLVPEEKILLCINPHNVAVTTLLKLSAQSSKSDLALLAVEMSISPEDKHTPIQILPNSSLHLYGGNRPIGLFILGFSSVRIFCPSPVASAFVGIGGMSILLCLVAMVSELSELYASLKALTCILQSSRIARREMNRIHGYQILAFLLKKKKELLNVHILHLVFSLVGTVRSDRESATIPSISAFTDLLCDLEIWHKTPAELEKSLFSHFYELITQGNDQERNIEYLRNLNCVSKLIYVIQNGEISNATLNTVANVLSVLLKSSSRTNDLLVVGQYLASTLSNSQSELGLSVEKNYTSGGEGSVQKTITQRNAILDVFHHLLFSAEDNSFCEQIYTTLGFDWVLLFIGDRVHKATVIRSVRVLFKMLKHPEALSAFQNGLANGSWLEGYAAVTATKPSTAAGFNIPNTDGPAVHSDHEVNHNSYKQKGFALLTLLLEEHTEINEIYFLLISILLNGDMSGIESGLKLNIETLYLIFWPPASSETIREQNLVEVYCLDAILVLLHMIRKIMSDHEELNTYSDFEKNNIPSAVMQFIQFLYGNLSEVEKFATTPQFLNGLTATLFPLDSEKHLSDSPDITEGDFDVIPADRFSLTNHTSKQSVINFLKDILIDSMVATTGKTSNFADLVLQSFPSTASTNQRRAFQTDLINAVLGEYHSGPKWNRIVSNGSAISIAKYIMNGVDFIYKIVDTLWSGYYDDDYKKIFMFIVRVIHLLEEHNLKSELIYQSLNRVLLNQFGRPSAKITQQTNLLEHLHLITSNSKIIFSSENHDSEFIASLTHWLIIVGLQSGTRKVSAISFSEDFNMDMDSSLEMSPGASVRSDEENELEKLIAAASERVWNVFYTHKKEVIEEVFGIQSSFISYEAIPITTAGRPVGLDLLAAKNLLGEQASKCWLSYIGTESSKRKLFNSLRPTKNLTKKWTKTLKREKPVEEVYTVRETLEWVGTHLRAVKALVAMRYAKHQQEILLLNNEAEKNWCKMELGLIQEGGIWGPEHFNPLEKWKLDDIEGPCRMRKRLTRNDLFYVHYPYAETVKEIIQTKHKKPFSHDSKLLYQLCQKYITSAPAQTPASSEQCNDATTKIEFSWRPKLFSADGFEAEDSVEEVNTQTIIQLLETGEKIYSMYRCARVCGLDSAEGLFLFGRGHFYLIDGFTLMSAETKQSASNAKEIKDISSLPEGSHEPLIPAAKGNSILKRSFVKWSFEEIKEAHKRRYLLQDCAIEVFSNDGSNHLLVFPKEAARNKVYDRIMRVSPTLATSHDSLSGMNSNATVESNQSLISTLLTGEKSITQKWVHGEINNFQYLMFLNTLAGRSYNDLMQYPIFPWILADYTNEFLDLTNPKTFRDLSKPMGAQGEGRLKNYRRRYKEWEDPTGKTPAYYYGTHYSSAMIVASYLIRLEPFTQHFLRLQGDHFDLPDRLFHCVKDAWSSASEANMADIKELIPEFYYLPDFLLNTNKFDLGTKQNGEQLNDVILPPWAKGDAIEFIRKHREALECDYVSSHLHEWIDLVFGHKQQGPAAVEADNVFHHLFYEGSVDLATIADPLERKATIGFINNFGQMPKQLFRKPHPTKKLSSRSADSTLQTGTLPQFTITQNEKLFFHHLNNLVPSVQPVKELRRAVGQISTAEKSFTAIELNQALFPTSFNRIGWGYGDFSLRYISNDDKLLAVFEGVFTGQILCAACLDQRAFVTGGTSTAVCIWGLEQKVKDKSYSLGLTKVLYGHHGDVLSLAISKAYNIIVTGSEDKSCIIWDLRKLTYTRRLSIPYGGPVTCICINNATGNIVSCAGTHLYIWTVNGELLVQHNTSPAISGQILSCAVSEYHEWDEANVIITGSADGVVKMWRVEFVDAAELDSSILETVHLSSGSIRSDDSGSKDYLLVKPPCPSKRDWRRQLVLRHKLTMHTAFSRADNIEAASVTALAISKDHRKLYIGDSRGRVYCWSLSDAVGRIADHWVKDEVADNCNQCAVRFTFSERRHHCRNCGRVFCGRCSRYESPIVHLRIFKAVRVCTKCYHELKRKGSLKKR